MLSLLVLCTVFLQLSECEVVLTGYDSAVVLGAQTSASLSCKITANEAVDSSEIKWSGASLGAALGISDSKVTWDSDSSLTKLTVEAVPAVTTEYTCSYGTVGGTAASIVVVAIAAVRGAALQNKPGMSTVSCILTDAESPPDKIYWTHDTIELIENVTTTVYDGTQSSTLKVYGVVSDSIYYCHWAWGQVEAKQSVPVVVGDVTLTGLALKLRGSGEFHCKILGFATLPDKVVWSKNGVEADTISIGDEDIETSWKLSVKSVSREDAVVYSCGIMFGNDILEASNQLVVAEPSITQALPVGIGSDLVLTSHLVITNIQSSPTSFWIDSKQNQQMNGVTTVSGDNAQSTVTLASVTAANEVAYTCTFVFLSDGNITSPPITPEVLIFDEEPQSEYGCVGEEVTFSCRGESGSAVAGNPSVNWYKDELVVAQQSEYSTVITEAGVTVTCEVTWDNTDVVITKTVSAILNSISGVNTYYATTRSSGVTLTCTFYAKTGVEPTRSEWYVEEKDQSLTKVEDSTVYIITAGPFQEQQMKSSLLINNVTLAFDYLKYRCAFTVQGKQLYYTSVLRILGIKLNVAMDTLSVKSGELVHLSATPSRDYNVTASWRWFKDSQPNVDISSSNALLVQSIRMKDIATYTVNAHFVVSVNGDNQNFEVQRSINITVSPSCNVGKLSNIKNGGSVPDLVENGRIVDIQCLNSYLLDDKSYESSQIITCESADYVELDVIDCVEACVLTVVPNDTEVTWRDKVLEEGTTHYLYFGDTFSTACNISENRTLPSGPHSKNICTKVGTINYTLCVDGCVFVSDDKINATFPEAMYDPSLIPIREKVTYECLSGNDNVYNGEKAFTCNSYYTNKEPINLKICISPVLWDWVLVGFAISLTLIALGMMVWGASLFFKRQRQKMKIMSEDGTDGVYTNPVAKEAEESEHLEMVEMCKSIEIGDFHNSYKQLMVDDCYALSLEYAKIGQEVPTSMFPITVAKQPALKAKNRFVDILPYDATLVPLQGDTPETTYINASFIHTLEETRKFIAAQGPKPETLTDFWRMVWEQNSHVIIMVTNFVEKGRRKCEEYWSDSQPQTYGNFTVQCLGVVSFPDYKVRKLSVVQDSGKARMITHYHYEGWPDHGVPDTPTSMISFAKRAFSDSTAGPLVAHCSAGVGRTGTLIALHLQMENMRKGQRINIYETVIQLRKCRKIMVQTESQYVFIYQAVNEILRCGVTDIYAQKITEVYRDLKKTVLGADHTGLQTEYRRLVCIANEDMGEKSGEALKDYNLNKNRYHNILPFEKNRVKLAYQTGIPGSDYINASYVSSHHERNVYISTQAPKENTLVDFWKMVYETGSSSIVCMTKLTEDGKIKCAQYWPSNEEEVIEFGSCRIKLIAVEEDQDVVKREMCVTHSSDEHHSVKLVRMWHFITLTEQNMRLDGLKMISVIENMSRWQKQQGNTPAVVHCGGGVGRGAAFIAIANCLEQLKLEGTVDILLTVLQLRRARPFMVQSLDQYNYVYQALVQYVESFDTYENFK